MVRARSPCLVELREEAALPAGVTGPRDLAPFSRAMSARVRGAGVSIVFSICVRLGFSGTGEACRIDFGEGEKWA